MSALADQDGQSTTIAVGARRLLSLGALVIVCGLAIGATSEIAGMPDSEHADLQQPVGGLIVLVGWAMLIWGVHRFGRASPA